MLWVLVLLGGGALGVVELRLFDYELLLLLVGLASLRVLLVLRLCAHSPMTRTLGQCLLGPSRLLRLLHHCACRHLSWILPYYPAGWRRSCSHMIVLTANDTCIIVCYLLRLMCVLLHNLLCIISDRVYWCFVSGQNVVGLCININEKNSYNLK